MRTRQLKYDSRTFPELKEYLLNYIKQYYPDYFSNFNDYSPEMMLLELGAVIGDNNNFYLDDRFKELFIQYCEEKESVFRNARSLGYKPKTVSVAVGNVQLSQLVPSKFEGGEYSPDYSYGAFVPINTIVGTINNSNFYTTIENIDFSISNEKNLDVVVDSVDEFDNPTFYRIIKNVKVRSGEVKTKQINITSPTPNLSLMIDSNVAFIESVTDSENNKWYEVDYLSQDIIFDSQETRNHGGQYLQYATETPFLLKVKRAPRRFEVFHKSNGECYLQFGSGTDFIDNRIKRITNSDLLSTNEITSLNINSTFIAENFINNDSYGLIPTNTILTIKYVTSRGEVDNTKANNVTNVVKIKPVFGITVSNDIRQSFLVNNREPITGAEFLNTVEKIKYEAPMSYMSQNRCVTVRDYILRCKVLPEKFGKIDKVFAELNDKTGHVDIYVLSRNSDNKLSPTNSATLYNLSVYLEQFKMISDVIVLKNPFIINIGVDFTFISKYGYNKNEVLLNVSKKVEEFFNVDNLEINQGLNIELLKQKMYEADGVQYISEIQLHNKYDNEEGYSGIEYDVTINGVNYDSKVGVLYPPKDVGIFELKYPNKDIRGRHG